MSAPCFTLHYCHAPTSTPASTYRRTHTAIRRRTTHGTFMAAFNRWSVTHSFRLSFMRAALIPWCVRLFATLAFSVNGYISSINNPLMACLFNAWRLKTTTYTLRCLVSGQAHTLTRYFPYFSFICYGLFAIRLVHLSVNVISLQNAYKWRTNTNQSPAERIV